MALKFQLLLLLILGVVFVQSARLLPRLRDIAARRQEKRSYIPYPPPYIPTTPPYNPYPAPTCDWPRGFCTYIYDPCPPNMVDCRNGGLTCPLPTNRCCCWRRPGGGYGRR